MSRLAERIRNTEPWCEALLKAPYIEVLSEWDKSNSITELVHEVRPSRVSLLWDPGFVVSVPSLRIKSNAGADVFSGFTLSVTRIESVANGEGEVLESFNGTQVGLTVYADTIFGELECGTMWWAEGALYNQKAKGGFINEKTLELFESKAPYLNDGQHKMILQRSLLCGVVSISKVTELLECKNVSLREVVSTRKKRRRSKKKRQVDSYYVLDIPGVGSYWKPGPKRDAQGIVRHHVCRGHFKTFTEDAPRFGRLEDGVGKFWIPSHARGNRKLGHIEKDYRLKDGTKNIVI